MGHEDPAVRPEVKVFFRGEPGNEIFNNISETNIENAMNAYIRYHVIGNCVVSGATAGRFSSHTYTAVFEPEEGASNCRKVALNTTRCMAMAITGRKNHVQGVGNDVQGGGNDDTTKMMRGKIHVQGDGKNHVQGGVQPTTVADDGPCLAVNLRLRGLAGGVGLRRVRPRLRSTHTEV